MHHKERMRLFYPTSELTVLMDQQPCTSFRVDEEKTRGTSAFKAHLKHFSTDYWRQVF